MAFNGRKQNRNISGRKQNIVDDVIQRSTNFVSKLGLNVRKLLNNGK